MTDLIESAGFVAGTSAMSVDIESPDARTSRPRLAWPRPRVLVLCRTRTADDRIVARTTDVVSVALLEARGLTDTAAVAYVRGRRSVYEAMAGLGVQVRDGVAEIMPWKADKELAAALGTKDGALLLRLDQTDFDLNGEPIISSIEYFLADAFKFQVYRKGTGARGSRPSSRRRRRTSAMSEFISCSRVTTSR